MIKIGSNIASLQAQQRLGEATSSLSKIYERLSSGQRINRASDDPVGLSLSSDLDVKTRIYTRGIQNISDGISLVSVADAALESLSNITIRIQELAEQAANGSLNTKQRHSLNQEAQNLSKEFTRIVQSTKFNGISVFDGGLPNGLQLQAAESTISSTLGGNVGDGTFGNSTVYNTDGGTTYAVSLIDINNDGNLDRVTAGRGAGGGSVRVALGNGSGSFSTSTTYSMDSVTSQYLQLSDLNTNLASQVAVKH